MNSIIIERTMFWSCWVDNKGAAISHLPPPDNGSITDNIILQQENALLEK